MRAECVLWSGRGAWLQVTDDFGIVRGSYFGKRPKAEVQAFCAERGIEFWETRANGKAGSRGATLGIISSQPGA